MPSSILSNIAPWLPQHPGFEGKLTNPSYLFSRSPYQLQHVNACKVSLLSFFCSINVSRCNFDAATSMDESNDTVSTIWSVSRWLHSAAMSQVSLLAILRYFGVDTLDLDVYRLDLDSAMSTAGPMDPTGTFQNVSGWLCDVGMSAVSGFTLSHLIDTYVLDLQSSVFAPRLPWHPGCEGKYLHPSDSLFRSPC